MTNISAASKSPLGAPISIAPSRHKSQPRKWRHLSVANSGEVPANQDMHIASPPCQIPRTRQSNLQSLRMSRLSFNVNSLAPHKATRKYNAEAVDCNIRQRKETNRWDLPPSEILVWNANKITSKVSMQQWRLSHK